MRYDTDKIKSSVSMLDLAERYGVTVRRGMCCCPFHGERHPSMKLYKDGFHCFACGAHGDVISWVMRFDSLGFNAACGRLSEWYGIDTLPKTKTLPDERRAALLNAYKAAERRVKELQPASMDEPPSPEFWQAVEERNRLLECL